MLRFRSNREATLFCGTVGALAIVFFLYRQSPSYSLFSLMEGSDLAPYRHFYDQLNWIVAYKNDTSDLTPKDGRWLKIYYDRVKLYHPTTPDGCRYKCEFPRDLEGLEKGDIVVFSGAFDIHKAKNLRRRGVFIAFETGESPYNMPHLSPSHLGLIDFFNNYRSVSPVPWLYESFVRFDRPQYRFSEEELAEIKTRDSRHLLPSFHANRTKLIAWVVSNSRPMNNRNVFADAISSFIKVDVYGGSGEPLRRKNDSFALLSSMYKFYLAFENSNCREYITEKATVNALSNGMVPIVMGAYKEDYERVLPPNSYINVDDFATIKNLTDYLLYLDGNDKAYATYFAWKDHGRIFNGDRADCRLCGYLYNLNAGNVSLNRLDPREFVDRKYLCFDRPLLPIS